MNSPSALSPSRAKSGRTELAEKLKTPVYRDNAAELSAIRSVQELQIDYTQALSIRRGDLAIIQGEVFRCRPKAEHLDNVPLIIKRLDCVDRRTYDLKVRRWSLATVGSCVCECGCLCDRTVPVSVD